MQYSAIPFNTMHYHAIPSSIIQYLAKPCNTMQYNAIPCNTMQYLAIPAVPCNTMQYHAIPYNTLQYYAIQCNTLQYHASLIKADGAYHCPVGSIWLFLYETDFTLAPITEYVCFDRGHDYQPHFPWDLCIWLYSRDRAKVSCRPAQQNGI